MNFKHCKRFEKYWEDNDNGTFDKFRGDLVLDYVQVEIKYFYMPLYSQHHFIGECKVESVTAQKQIKLECRRMESDHIQYFGGGIRDWKYDKLSGRMHKFLVTEEGFFFSDL